MPRATIMTLDDQFEIAAATLGFLESIGISLTEEQDEQVFEAIVDFTDDFSIGDYWVIARP